MASAERPATAPVPPPASVRPERWADLEPAAPGDGTAAALAVTIVIDGDASAGALERTRASIEAQDHPADLITTLEASDGGVPDGDLVLLVRAGAELDPQAVSTHAVWHSAAGDLITTGGVDPASGALDADSYGLLMDLTRDLGDRGHGLYLLAGLGTLGVRSGLLAEAGGLGQVPDPRWAESRLDLAHRLACAGGLFVASGAAASAPGGLEDDGLVAAAGEALASGRSLDADWPRLAAAIPLPPFRSGPSPRRLARPAVAVELQIDERIGPDEALESLTAILDGRLGDFELRVDIADGHPAREPIAAATETDPRASLDLPDPERRPSLGTAAYRITVPAPARLDHRTLADLHHMALGEEVGALHVTVPGELPAEAMIEVADTAALARAERIAAAEGRDPVEVLGAVFGERWVSGVEVSVLRHGVKSPHITEHGPLAEATDPKHERTQHLRFRDRADDLDDRVAELERRTFAERLEARRLRIKAEKREAKLAGAGPAPKFWRLRPIRSRLRK